MVSQIRLRYNSDGGRPDAPHERLERGHTGTAEVGRSKPNVRRPLRRGRREVRKSQSKATSRAKESTHEKPKPFAQEKAEAKSNAQEKAEVRPHAQEKAQARPHEENAEVGAHTQEKAIEGGAQAVAELVAGHHQPL